MKRHHVLSLVGCLVTIAFLYSPAGLAAKPSRDPRCFSMTPQGNIDDQSCGAVKVKIQFKNCSSGDATKSLEAYAHFDCHAKVPKLKYWYRNVMLFGDLQKGDDGYQVVRTYGIRYGAAKDADEVKEVEMNAAAVLPPGNTGNASGSGDASSAAASTTAQNDALKAQALSELSQKPAETAPVPSAAPVAAATPVPTVAPVVPSPEIAPAPIPEAAPSKSLLNALSNVKLGASLDGYYAYNFNQPPNNSLSPSNYGPSPAATNIYLLPNAYHDQLALALARASLYEDANPVGFRIDLGFGPLADQVASAYSGVGTTGSDSSTRALMQGYLSYKTPFGLQIDAGKMYSNIGFENVDPALNWNFSYTLGFRFLAPWWSTGVRATMPIVDRVSVGAYLNNGVNSFYQDHRTKDAGAQIRIAPIDSLKIILNYLSGDEGVATSDVRSTYEGIAVYSPMENLKVAVDYIMSTENAAANSSQIQASSIAGFVNWNFWKRFYLLPRYEFFNDGGVSYGSMTGGGLGVPAGGQTISSATLGLEYRPEDNFRIQLEYRQDQSNQSEYTSYTGTGGPVGTQAVATLSAMLTY